LKNGITVLGLAGPRAQAFEGQRTIRGGVALSGRPGLVRDSLFPPLTRGRAKSSLEASIEEAQVVETAFFGHVDDFGVSVPQQRHGS
jgi:hypothetical protein